MRGQGYLLSNRTPPAALEVFAEYRKARTGLLARLEALPLADWWRTGQLEKLREANK